MLSVGANRDKSARGVGGSANRVGSNSSVVDAFAANQSVSKQSRAIVAAAPQMQSSRSPMLSSCAEPIGKRAAPANRMLCTQHFAPPIAVNVSSPLIE